MSTRIHDLLSAEADFVVGRVPIRWKNSAHAGVLIRLPKRRAGQPDSNGSPMAKAAFKVDFAAMIPDKLAGVKESKAEKILENGGILGICAWRD